MSDFKSKLPEVKFNKNGYEIRTEVLDMAKDLVTQEYSYKWNGWEQSLEKDKDGRVVAKTTMPQWPGLDKVLETAEKMYSFVNGNPKAK
jgi:hypothetical protein